MGNMSCHYKMARIIIECKEQAKREKEEAEGKEVGDQGFNYGLSICKEREVGYQERTYGLLIYEEDIKPPEVNKKLSERNWWEKEYGGNLK